MPGCSDVCCCCFQHTPLPSPPALSCPPGAATGHSLWSAVPRGTGHRLPREGGTPGPSPARKGSSWERCPNFLLYRGMEGQERGSGIRRGLRGLKKLLEASFRAAVGKGFPATTTLPGAEKEKVQLKKSSQGKWKTEGKCLQHVPQVTDY